jgi:hypothetical protein
VGNPAEASAARCWNSFGGGGFRRIDPTRLRAAIRCVERAWVSSLSAWLRSAALPSRLAVEPMEEEDDPGDIIRNIVHGGDEQPMKAEPAAGGEDQPMQTEEPAAVGGEDQPMEDQPMQTEEPAPVPEPTFAAPIERTPPRLRKVARDRLIHREQVACPI